MLVLAILFHVKDDMEIDVERSRTERPFLLQQPPIEAQPIYLQPPIALSSGSAYTLFHLVAEKV